VSPNLLDALGVKIALGRNFLPDEDQPGKDNVVILTHGLWRRGFGGDPNVFGRAGHVNGVARTNICVKPPERGDPARAPPLAPLAMTQETMRNRTYHTNLVVGRLKKGVSAGQAQSDLEAIAGRLELQHPNTNTGRGVRVFPILEDTVREYKMAMMMMMAAVAF